MQIIRELNKTKKVTIRNYSTNNENTASIVSSDTFRDFIAPVTFKASAKTRENITLHAYYHNIPEIEQEATRKKLQNKVYNLIEKEIESITKIKPNLKNINIVLNLYKINTYSSVRPTQQNEGDRELLTKMARMFDTLPLKDPAMTEGLTETLKNTIVKPFNSLNDRIKKRLQNGITTFNSILECIEDVAERYNTKSEITLIIIPTTSEETTVPTIACIEKRLQNLKESYMYLTATKTEYIEMARKKAEIAATNTKLKTKAQKNITNTEINTETEK